jgi:hypothetical protein
MPEKRELCRGIVGGCEPDRSCLAGAAHVGRGGPEGETREDLPFPGAVATAAASRLG